MAEAPESVVSVELRPEALEFVPERLNHQASRRVHPRSDHNQKHGDYERTHPNSRDFNPDRNETSGSATFPSRGAYNTRPEIRRDRGRGGTGRTRHGEHWSQSSQWSKSRADHGPPKQGEESNRAHQSNSSPTYRSMDGNGQHRDNSMVDSHRDVRDSWPKRSKRGRGDARKPSARENHAVQENQEGADAISALPTHPTEFEHDQSFKAGRGRGRPAYPRKTGTSINSNIEKNWRERAPPEKNSVEENQSKDESEGRKESNWRGGVKKYEEKRSRMHEQGQRRAGGPERKTGPEKRSVLPKSKETQTACLIEQLTEEKYECMVCCDVVRVMAPVWSCQSCFHVFHLNCIKKWARSPASQADEKGDGWRCPACQNVASQPPTSYICFCGKVTNPEFQRNEIPHSCGDICGKKRTGGECIHRCNILCHPGPCPPCPAFITKSCICGRTSKQVRCSLTEGLRCGQVCAAQLNCTKHSCTEVCHQGPCQPCQLKIQQVCYCGVAHREVACGTDRDNFDGFGHFCCQKLCGKMLGCRSHRCHDICHPGQCKPCPLLPNLVHSCPCNQTPLSKLLELGYPERKSCTDPVPSCGKTCNKPLPCGDDDTIHLCLKICHEDKCGPCSLNSTIRCRCGSKTKEAPCALIQSEEDLTFTCEKRCGKKRSCGRHKCGELCCVDLEHKCSLICGYKLNCGHHRCQEVCHRGNCQPCWQTSFDELSCYCGETVMYPPIPCGTKPPECKNPCTRQHDCDHPVFHSCHSDETCPPCTYLTKKWCMGNHEQRSNIPCHLQDISCGLVCNKALPCGFHCCKKICHRGECQSESLCKQPCPQPRPECGHPCNAPCHPGSSCPHTTCNAKVSVQCDCGRRKETVICTEAASSSQRYAAISMASKLSDMRLGGSVNIGQLTKKDQTQARLECDQDCATLERNRRLAEALQIDDTVDPFNAKASSSKYSDSLKDDARKEFKFVSDVEEEIRNLVELVNKGKQTRRSHSFPPMKREQRRIVHELAEVYGVESVSYDSEPKRNIVITAIKGKSSCPPSSLSSLIERETAARAPPPIAHVKQYNSRVDGGTAWKNAKEDSVIDYFDVQD